MVAFFLFPSAFADQRQLYQAGFMAPYASTYSAVASPQMYAPVGPETMYASQEMMYASPEQYTYAYPAAYPVVYEQETSDWSNAAMLAVAGAVVGGVIGYKTKQGSTAPQKRAAAARAADNKVAMLLFSGKGAAPQKGKSNEFCYGLPGNFNALGGTQLDWDPAGFLDGKSELEVNRYREAELVHGRVGMLAAAGFLVQEKFHPLFSGDGGPAIDQIPQLPVWLWVVMTAGIGAAEAKRISIGFRELDGEKLKAETALRPGYVPGDLGFDPLGLAPEDPVEFRAMQEKELAHARLGMIAAAGFLAQEAVSKATWGTYWGAPDF
jgi:hypothetical protein